MDKKLKAEVVKLLDEAQVYLDNQAQSLADKGEPEDDSTLIAMEIRGVLREIRRSK